MLRHSSTRRHINCNMQIIGCRTVLLSNMQFSAYQVNGGFIKKTSRLCIYQAPMVHFNSMYYPDDTRKISSTKVYLYINQFSRTQTCKSYFVKRTLQELKPKKICLLTLPLLPILPLSDDCNFILSVLETRGECLLRH